MKCNVFVVSILCGYMCQISGLNLRDLKDTACQITYKAIYQDLVAKEVAHRQGRYNMTLREKKSYEATIQQYFHDCVPKDPVIDKIERNPPIQEITMP